MSVDLVPFVRKASGSFGLQVGGLGLTFVAHLALARALGSDAFGEFTTASSWTTILVLLAVLGFDSSLIRFISGYRASEDLARLRGVMQASRFLSLGVGVLVGLGLLAVATVFEERMGAGVARALAVSAGVLPLMAFARIQEASLCGWFHVVRGQVALQVLRPLFLLLGAGIALVAGIELDSARAMTIQLGAFALAAALLTWQVRAAVPGEVRRAPPVRRASDVREWFRVSAPMLAVSSMRVLLAQTDVVIVAAVVGVREAGFYAVASRVARLISLGLSAGNTVASPFIADRAARGELDDLQDLVRRASRVATVVSLVVAVALLAVGRWALSMFGEEFPAAYPVLAILAFGHVVNAMTGPVGQILNLAGFERDNARIFLAITLLNVALNLPAVLLFGIEGAAGVTSVLLAVKNVWCWLLLRKRMGIDSSVLGIRRVVDEVA